MKYLSLLVAIPPLFGAIWQLIELSKLSLSYIRFFSISQLVADGTLVLIILVFFLFWGVSIYPNILKSRVEDSVNEEKNETKINYYNNQLVINSFENIKF
mgnify:CR=1 FL=1